MYIRNTIIIFLLLLYNLTVSFVFILFLMLWDYFKYGFSTLVFIFFTIIKHFTLLPSLARWSQQVALSAGQQHTVHRDPKT